MILEDTVRIEVPPDNVFNFFNNMEKNFVDWHPEHIYFEWSEHKEGVSEGKPIQAGTEFYMEEWIFGEIRTRRFRIFETAHERLIELRPVQRTFRLFVPRITFEMLPLGDSATLFQSRIEIRMGSAVRSVFGKYLEHIQIHMREENEYLKKILEQNR